MACAPRIRDFILTAMLVLGGEMVLPCSSPAKNYSDEVVPVLLVRGIASQDHVLLPMQRFLEHHGLGQIAYASYDSFFGEAPLEDVAAQIKQAALALMAKSGSTKVDVVAFSMGALSTRYMIQRLGGKTFVRKFVSISGPHNGSFVANLAPFFQGVQAMRPGSEFIEDLNRDVDPWGKVRVYSFYTPHDLIVLPGTSGILARSVEVKSFPIPFHHQMIEHETVLLDIVRVLKESRQQADLETTPKNKLSNSYIKPVIE